SPSGSNLTVTTAPGATSAGIVSNIVNSSILFKSAAGQSVVFALSGVGTSQLTINGAGASISSDTGVTVPAGLAVSSPGIMNVVTPFLTNDGTISTTGVNQLLSLSSPSGSNLLLAGSGTLAAGATSSSTPPTDGSLSIYSPTGTVEFSGLNSTLQAQL